jgi:hypothetical protein
LTQTEIDLILTAAADGLDSLRDTVDLLKDLRQQALETDAALLSLNVIGLETGRVLRDIRDNTQGASVGMNNLSSASGRGRSGMLGFLNAILPGGQAAAVLISVIVALAVAFAPLTAAVLAATVATGAFIVGLAGALSTVVIAAAPVVGLAIGVGLLADALYKATNTASDANNAISKLAAAQRAHETALNSLEIAQIRYNTSATPIHAIQLEQAQQNLAHATTNLATAQNNLTAAQLQAAQAGQGLEDPLGALEDHLKSVAAVLGAQAYPLLVQMADAADQLVGPIQQAGSAAITWFAGVLPFALQVASNLFAGLRDVVLLLTPVFLGFFQQVADHAPLFNEVFFRIGSLVVEAIIGILENLLRLSDWFTARLPAMMPLVEAAFSGMGSLIQGIGSVFGAVVDFFIQNWPQISSTAQATWNAISSGWNSVSGFLSKEGPAVFAILQASITFLTQHADLFRAVFQAVGVVVGIVIGLFLVAVTAVDILIVVLGAIIAAAAWVRDRFNDITKAIGDWLGRHDVLVTGLGILWGILANSVGPFAVMWGAIDHLVGSLQAAVGWIQGLIGWIQNIPAFKNVQVNIQQTGGGGAGYPNVTPQAVGGPLAAGQSFMVGESGAELLTLYPGGGGYASPMTGGLGSNLRAATGGGAGGPTYVINIYGVTDPGAVAIAVDNRLSALMNSR